MDIGNHCVHCFGHVHFMVIFEPQIDVEIDKFLCRLNTNVSSNISGQEMPFKVRFGLEINERQVTHCCVAAVRSEI